MRLVTTHDFIVTLWLILPTIVVSSIPFSNELSPFYPALGSDSFSELLPPSPNTTFDETEPAQVELRKRQSSSCPSSYINCNGIGAPGLCCAGNSVCSADYAGHVACCPTRAACTGTIGGAGATATATTTNSQSFVLASTATTAATVTGQAITSNGVIIVGGSSTAAFVAGNAGGRTIDNVRLFW